MHAQNSQSIALTHCPGPVPLYPCAPVLLYPSLYPSLYPPLRMHPQVHPVYVRLHRGRDRPNRIKALVLALSYRTLI